MNCKTVNHKNLSVVNVVNRPYLKKLLTFYCTLIINDNVKLSMFFKLFILVKI